MMGLRCAILAAALALFAAGAVAQQTDAPGQDIFAPGLVAPSAGFGEPAKVLPTPAPSGAPAAAAGTGQRPAAAASGGEQHRLILEARLTPDGAPLQDGVTWRVFGTAAGADGHLPLIESVTGGTTAVRLAPGDYIVHAALGRAGLTKRVTIGRGDQTESLNLDAGGLKLDAVVGQDRAVPADRLNFEVSHEDENGDLVTIVPHATPGRIIGLSAGTYHVTSRYGNVNAVVQADIEVEAGKLTEAVLHHTGAEVTLKLVSEEGGEALANTSWVVTTQDGTKLHESIGAFPSIILAAGTYTAVATHQEQNFTRDFTVEAGIDRDIEVRLSDVAVPEQPPSDAVPAASGDEPMEPDVPDESGTSEDGDSGDAVPGEVPMEP